MYVYIHIYIYIYIYLFIYFVCMVISSCPVVALPFSLAAACLSILEGLLLLMSLFKVLAGDVFLGSVASLLVNTFSALDGIAALQFHKSCKNSSMQAYMFPGTVQKYVITA